MKQRNTPLRTLLPTLWRYFFSQYVKVFSLTLFGFLILLLSTRLEDFARFVALGANFGSACLFVIYQIPYVMQTAIIVASLIASFFLFQKLSQSQTLTACRASGMSLFSLITPLLFLSSLIALFTFQILLNMASAAHFRAKRMEHRLLSMNPLSLMSNSKMLAGAGVSIEMDGSLQRDGKTKDFIMAIRSKDHGVAGTSGGKSALFIAKEMHVEDNRLKGTNLSLISTVATGNEDLYDHLAIENAKENVILLEDLSQAMVTKRLKLTVSELSFPMLLAKRADLNMQIQGEKELTQGKSYLKQLWNKTTSEIVRRISLAFSIITFSLLGAAFGITTLRTNSRKRLVDLILLASFFLFCMLGAKAFEYNALIASIFYIAPQLILISLSLIRLKRIQQGCEK